MTATVPQVTGAVDGLKPPSQISGWAKNVSHPDRRVHVTALFKSVLVAEGETSLQRTDVGGHYGFALSAPGIEVQAALVNGDLQILADGERLSVWDGLSRRLSHAATGAVLPELELTTEYSEVRLPVGLMSAASVATVGRDGHLFLVGGSNNLLGRYLADDADEQDELAAEWARIVVQRTERFAGRATFLQMFIPEKSSALPKLFPFAVASPLPIYCKTMAKMESDGRLPVLDCYPFLRDDEACFRKLNSHLSSRGCLEVFRAVLKALELPPVQPITFGARSYEPSDLGIHFFGRRIAEQLSDDLARDQPGLHGEGLVLQSEQRVERHVGTRATWRNATAPINKKVVAFANSFFEVGRAPTALSWWFARWFSEYHFIWDPNVDYDYVERVRPDIVIAQTIERFLYVVPKS